jgi:hypothetical protein
LSLAFLFSTHSLVNDERGENKRSEGLERPAPCSGGAACSRFLLLPNVWLLAMAVYLFSFAPQRNSIHESNLTLADVPSVWNPLITPAPANARLSSPPPAPRAQVHPRTATLVADLSWRTAAASTGSNGRNSRGGGRSDSLDRLKLLFFFTPPRRKV